MAAQWTPYQWDPVTRPGEDLRLTLRIRGEVEAIEATIQDQLHPFVLSAEGAQLLIPSEEARRIPDRAPVQVRVKTGGAWTVLMQGHLLRRQ